MNEKVRRTMFVLGMMASFVLIVAGTAAVVLSYEAHDPTESTVYWMH